MATLIRHVLLSLLMKEAIAVSHADVVRLYSDIFTNYTTVIRPLRNQSEAITVWFDMYFINIQELDMRSQLLTTSGWHHLVWTDEFLVWEVSEYGGLEEIYVHQDQIWLPRISFFNTKTTSSGRGFGSQSKMDVHIKSNGKVSWEPDFILESTCTVDITKFPFDTQLCEIQFCSWSVLNKALKIRIKTESNNVVKFALPNGEFLVDGFSCRMGGWKSRDLIVCSLKLTRRVYFYIFSLLIPLVILSLLSVISFLVPAESGEKMTVSMTTLLSFTVYLGVLDSIMPKSSDNISILLTYVTLLMSLSLLSVAGNTTVLYLYYRYGERPVSRSPKVHAQSHSMTEKNPSAFLPTSSVEDTSTCLSYLWNLGNKWASWTTSKTSKRQKNNIQMSHFVNKLAMSAMSVILILVMICIVTVYKVS